MDIEMRKYSLLLLTIMIVLLCFSLPQALFAQVDEDDTRHTLYEIPPRWIVDIPTAGTLPRGYYDISMRMFANGGANGYINIGISDRFLLGISYGGENVVAGSGIDWNPRIGFALRFRIIDELEYFPAISVGYSDQGHGTYFGGPGRYQYKSLGFYGVASRSFYFYRWTAGWHGGLNYSLEDDNGDQDLNLFVGVDATFNYNLALLAEYDFALNDNKGSAPLTGKGRGYLDLSIKWLFTESLELELIAKDIFVNRREASEVSREMRITFVDSF